MVLFVYVTMITAGTGGAVSFALLHHRLRTPTTRGFLVSNSALLGSLLLALVSYYLDTVLVAGVGGRAFSVSTLRSVAGFGLGVLTYGGVVQALHRLPGSPGRLLLGVFVVVVVGMAVQGGLIVAGREVLAMRTGIVYMYLVSAGLFALGLVAVRHGPAASTPTMAWFVVRFGYLSTGFAVLSTAFYSAVYLVPILQGLSFSLDFLYYLVWSMLSIGAFLRYLARPTALLADDELSASFVNSFGVTPREQEVIRLIAEGLSNQEIADRLGVSFATARTHVYNIFQKTGAGSRVDLLRLVSGFRE